MVFLVKKNNGINKGVKFAMKIVYITSTYTIKMIMNERQVISTIIETLIKLITN